MDILSAFEIIKVATADTSGGERHENFPAQQSVLYHCEPEYEELAGWGDDITSVRSYADLPAETRAYIEYIQEGAGVPVGWVSVGPERSQLIEVS
jgi:adenylosuccinate synthase